MLDIYEAMPNGDWKFTKTDDKFDTIKVKVDPAAEAVNPLIEADNRRAKSGGNVDQESMIRDFYHDPSSGHFVSTTPKGMIELKDDVRIGYNQKKGKDVYGDMLVVTNQGKAKKEDFDNYMINLTKHVGQNTDVEHALTIYDDKAQLWNNKEMFSVNVQPMLDVMNADGGNGPAPERYAHTHTMGAYPNTPTKFYNLGSSKNDQRLVRDVLTNFPNSGYANTKNSVFAPMTRDELIDYNGDGDLDMEDNLKSRTKLHENVSVYDYFRGNK